MGLFRKKKVKEVTTCAKVDITLINKNGMELTASDIRTILMACDYVNDVDVKSVKNFVMEVTK